MNHQSYIDFSDIMRYIEEKYGCIVDSRNLQRMLARLKQKRSTRDRECERLKGTLSELKNIDVGCVSYVTCRADSALHSFCWSFSQ